MSLDYQFLYRLTAAPTPLKSNCGDLCGSICCQPGKQDNLGAYLFPGEEIMFTRSEDWLLWEEQDPADYDFPLSWPKPVYFVRCNGACPRDMRPLACRFFPLAPHLHRDGRLQLLYETMELPYQCPLITAHYTLEAKFIHTVQQAWQLMLTDRRIRDLVEEDSRRREEDGLPVVPV
ncbi:MAG: hypothetical protein FWC60_03920 [Firmicutes bacterium]|nr:hypothetical protein [Bacillota bacterium]